MQLKPGIVFSIKNRIKNHKIVYINYISETMRGNENLNNINKSDGIKKGTAFQTNCFQICSSSRKGKIEKEEEEEVDEEEENIIPVIQSNKLIRKTSAC